ncbi:AKR_collapsed_G0005670.mRNA.1.CDS.1 [Saccharomyces cerevisiae]|nr:AKR_collapsed_G0005670.mRNA.1.CDS.1 [Saccharomyces cerevisiae]
MCRAILPIQCRIIDCWFEYEYTGGHIINSVNILGRDELEYEFIHKHNNTSTNSFNYPLRIWSFPLRLSLASHLRNCDRIIRRSGSLSQIILSRHIDIWMADTKLF